METHDELKERVRREQQLAARLRLATERLEEAQRERIWAIVEAHQSGLSIRQIASATGLSPSRVHQLLGSEEAREIPRWLGQQRGRNRSDKPSQTEYVSFDRPRVLRVLARVIADLDELAGLPPIAEEEGAKVEDAEARRVRHRQRLAEPDPPPKRLSMREERAALRALLDLPPYERG